MQQKASLSMTLAYSHIPGGRNDLCPWWVWDWHRLQFSTCLPDQQPISPAI